MSRLLAKLAARYPRFLERVGKAKESPAEQDARRVRLGRTLDRLHRIRTSLTSGAFDPFEEDFLDDLERLERVDVWGVTTWEQFLLLKGKHDHLRKYTERLRSIDPLIRQYQAELKSLN